MADTNANIRIDVDTSQALANIKNLQREISRFHSSMATGGARAAASSKELQQNLINSVNVTKGFSAQLTTIQSSAESFTTALEKNKLSLGQYFRFAGASTKTFGKLFKSEFNTIEKVARERVKGLQTQYIKLGRDANGALKAIKVRPLVLDMQNLGTQTAMAAQKVQLFNQLVRQGSTNLLNWGKNTQWAGRQLMVGFTVPLTIFGTMAAREFQKLEEQAIKFRRVYGDMFTTDADTEKALGNIRQLADEFTKYGIAVEKTIGLGAKVAQMGNVGNALEQQVIQATRLSVLGGLEQEEALDTTISLTNAFGIAIEDLASKINFLNAAENQTILAIEDFNTAIPLAGSVVKQLGGDVEDLAFFLTAMREGGINASQGANALKSSLARLINPTKASQERLAEMGINVMGIVEQNAGDLRGTVMTLAHALEELDPLTRARAIEQLFGKFQFARMSTLLSNIVDEGSQANKVLQLTTNSAEELAILADRELGRVEESAATKFTKMVEKLKSDLAPIGEAFLKAVTPVVEFASKLIDRFNKMGDGAKQFVVVLSAIGGVVAPALLMVIGLVANGIANLVKFGSVVGKYFGMASGSSRNLGEQTEYLTQQQAEQLTIAASLDQVHSDLTQTFTAQADAVSRLVAEYERAIAKQREMGSVGGMAAGGAAAAAGASASGKTPKKYAKGVVSVPGPKGAGDIVPAMLSPGEAVIPAEMARKYGPLINEMISDNIPGYAVGLFAPVARGLANKRAAGMNLPKGAFSKTDEAVVAFGAHQPFTIAHQNIADQGMALASSQNSRFMQYTTEAFGKSKKHLLPLATKLKLIKESLGFPATAVSNPFALMENLKSRGISKATLMLGTDRMSSKVFDEAAKQYGINLVKQEIPRGPNDVSGTQTRLAIAAADKTKFGKLIASRASESTKNQVFKEIAENMTGYQNGVLSVPGPKGAGDIVPAMVAPGEAIIPADIVDKYRPLVQSIISDNVPGFSEGGEVSVGSKTFRVARADSAGAIQSRIAEKGYSEEVVTEALRRLAADAVETGETLKVTGKDFKIVAKEVAAELGEVTDPIQRSHTSANVPASDPRMMGPDGSGALRDIGWDKIPEEYQQYLYGTTNLTADLPKSFNLKARNDSATVGEFESAWFGRTGKYQGSAEAGGLDLGNQQNVVALQQLEDEVGQEVLNIVEEMKAEALARGESVDNIRIGDTQMAEAAQRVIARYEEVEGALGDSARALRVREQEIGEVRFNPGKDVVEAGIASGKMRRRQDGDGVDVLGTDGEWVSNVARGGGSKSSYYNKKTVGGRNSYANTPMRSEPVERDSSVEQQVAEDAREDAQIRNEVMESTLEDPYPLSTKDTRNSPHPNAEQDGFDDQTAYNKGRDNANKSNPLAPPPPPEVPDVAPTRKQKIGAAIEDSKIGQGIGKFLAKQSGVALTDSKGNITYDPNKDMSTWAGKMEAANQQQLEAAKEAARQQVEAANRLEFAADELNASAQMQESAAGEQSQAAQLQEQAARQEEASARQNQSDTPASPGRATGRGKLAGGLFMAGSVAMGASMMGGPVGDIAGKVAAPLMAIGGIMPLLSKLPGKIQAVLIVLGLLAYGVRSVLKAFDNTAKKTLELESALGRGKDAIDKFAEFSGNVTASQIMERRREAGIDPFQVAPGKTTVGENFFASAVGEDLLQNAKDGILAFGKDATVNKVFMQLGQAVASGAIDTAAAMSIASELGTQLQDRSFGIQIRSQLLDLTDPTGTDLLVDPLQIQAKINLMGQENLEDLISVGPKTMDETFEEGVKKMSDTWDAYGFGALLKGDWWDGFLRSDHLTKWFFNQSDNVARMAEIVGAARNQVESLSASMDSIEVEFDKKIQDAISSGDSLSYIEDLRAQKLQALEDVIVQRQLAIDTALAERATDPGKFDLSMKQSLGQMFEGDQLKQAENLFSRISRVISDEEKALNLEFLMSTGDIPIGTITQILDDWDKRPAFAEKRLELATNFGKGMVQEIDAVLAAIDDPKLQESYIAILDPKNLEQSRSAIDAVTAAARVAGSAFGGIGDSIIGSFVEGPGADAARERLNRDLAKLELVDAKMIDMTQPKESNFIFNTFGEEAFYIAQALWDQVEDGEEKNALYSILTLLDLETTPAYEEFLQSSMGDTIAGINISNDFTARAALAARSLQQGRLASSGISEDLEEAAGGGGQKLSSVLDDIVKKLRDVRMNQIIMTNGWVESANKLEELFGKGKGIDIFSGLEQDMRRMGLGEDLIAMIVGMDPEEFEQKKDQLFVFDAAGDIVGITNLLHNMGRALQAVAMGDFQSEQEKTIRNINDQIIAMRKLTAAGMSQADAYQAVQNAALAAAIAQEKNTKTLKELARITKEAAEMTRAFAAAQGVANKNQEAANRRQAVEFVQRNLGNLTDSQIDAILSDPNLQALIGTNIDPKALRQALKDAENAAQLELEIKKLTFEGQLSIFEDGFNKAMEKFQVLETEIRLEFQGKKEPYLEEIKQAEREIQDIRNRAGGLDDLEADLQRISWQEQAINKEYDERLEALDKVEKLQSRVQQQAQDQLDVADALSRGDIAAAARAAQQARKNAAEAAAKDRRDKLEESRQAELNSLVGNMGLTREQLDAQILALQKEIFEIEESRLEPARQAVDLLERQEEDLISSLTVLGKTKDEWTRINNQVQLAKVNTEQYRDAMQEALDIVESIVTYWDNFDPDPKQIVIEEKTIKSTEMADSSADVTPRETGGGGGGGGGGSDPEDLGRFVGQQAASTQQSIQRGTTLDAMRPGGAPYSIRQAEAVDDAIIRARDLRAIADEAKAQLDDLEARAANNPGNAILQKWATDAREAYSEANLLAEDAEKTASQAMTALAQKGLKGAEEIYNTGAVNLLDASRNLFSELSNNAEGPIANNIAGYFADLGVRVPTLLQAIPSFFTELPPGIEDHIKTQIGDHFKVLATNVTENLGPIGDVFRNMPDDVRESFESEILPTFQRYGMEELPGSLESIKDWWHTLNPMLQEEVMPLISAQMLGVGEQAALDLEGTVSTYWENLPGTVKDQIESNITPVLQAEAEKMGISVEELLTQKFIDMPEETRQAIEQELAQQFTNMSISALQSIAQPGSAIAALGDSIAPAAATAIANALRGAALNSEVDFQEVQKFIAQIPEGQNVVQAIRRTFPGLIEEGADAAIENLGSIPDAIVDMPQDQAVQAAVTGNSNGSFPYLFGQGGDASGKKFGDEAISQITQSIADYQRTKPTITIKVKYDAEQPTNVGGTVLPLPKLNAGGPVARFARGGMLPLNRKVPGTANYDKVRTLLTPGEFVIRKEAVQKYGESFMHLINSAKLSPQTFSTPTFQNPSAQFNLDKENLKKTEMMYNNSYQINVNVKSESNADQIAKTVMEQIKRVDAQRMRGSRI